MGAAFEGGAWPPAAASVFVWGLLVVLLPTLLAQVAHGVDSPLRPAGGGDGGVRAPEDAGGVLDMARLAGAVSARLADGWLGAAARAFPHVYWAALIARRVSSIALLTLFVSVVVSAALEVAARA